MEKKIEKGSRVLVTGATGYTGKFLVKELLRQGCIVKAIARPSSDISSFDGMAIEWFRGDIFDADTIQAAMLDIQYVFHVAAAFREAKSSYRDYWNVHVVSTQLLCKEALKIKDFKRFVLVSTMGVHGHIASPPGNEASPFIPGDDYQRTKAEADLWVSEFCRENRLPFSVIRPCAIYGPGERRLLKIFKMANRSWFPILGNGKCWYHLIHVEDLVGSIVRAAVEEKAIGEAFCSGADTPIRLEEMAALIARTYGHKLRIIRLPITPFFILGAVCEWLCKPFGVEPPIYRRRVAFYSKDRYFDTTKLREVLGFQPRYDNETGIVESARWYKENDWL